MIAQHTLTLLKNRQSPNPTKSVMNIPVFPETKSRLKGKKRLIVGIANDQSIAGVCAKAFRALGADLAVTYLNEKARKHSPWPRRWSRRSSCRSTYAHGGCPRFQSIISGTLSGMASSVSVTARTSDTVTPGAGSGPVACRRSSLGNAVLVVHHPQYAQ